MKLFVQTLQQDYEVHVKQPKYIIRQQKLKR